MLPGRRVLHHLCGKGLACPRRLLTCVHYCALHALASPLSRLSDVMFKRTMSLMWACVFSERMQSGFVACVLVVGGLWDLGGML